MKELGSLHTAENKISKQKNIYIQQNYPQCITKGQKYVKHKTINDITVRIRNIHIS